MREAVNLIDTGILHKISCLTENGGLRYLEACPDDNVVKALPESSTPNQLWFIESYGNFYKIKCLTSNGGLRCLEAFPLLQTIRPSIESSDTDQLWSIEAHENLFKITCKTRNGGLTCVEAFPLTDVVRPRPESKNKDQLWMFTPTNFKVTTDEINNFDYDDISLDIVAEQRQDAVIWDLTDKNYTDTEIYDSDDINFFTCTFAKILLKTCTGYERPFLFEKNQYYLYQPLVYFPSKYKYYV